MPKALLRAALATAILSPLGAAATAQPLPIPPVLHPHPPMPVRPIPREAFATPRFVAISASGAMKPMDGVKMCEPPNPFGPLEASLREGAPAAELPIDRRGGCATSFKHPAPGEVLVERTCRRADGATSDSYHRMSGSSKRLDSHMELTVHNPTGKGSDKSLTFDMTMTDLGPCPANVKPGQMVARDGKIRDARPADRPDRAAN